MKIKRNVIIILLLIIISINTYSLADVGSFDRYDSGDSGWSSSSDWGSSSWDLDSDYDSSGDGGFLLGLLLGNNIGGPILLIIIIYIIIMAVAKSKGGNTPPRRYPRYNYKPQSTQYTQGKEPVVDVSQSHIYADRIKKFDPLFSEEKFLSWTKDLFVKLQNAWTSRDWEPMRPFETEELFDQHKAQIQGYIDTHRINVMDRIAVNYATIYNFRQEAGKDILEIALKSTMKDYIVKEDTKEVLEGNPNQDRITVYKLTFERTTGVLTKEGEIKIDTTNCPNCGAPTQITSSGRCEYCGSVITTKDYGWVLAGLEPLRQ